jgi:hypothetical protein
MNADSGTSNYCSNTRNDFKCNNDCNHNTIVNKSLSTDKNLLERIKCNGARAELHV